MTYQNELADWIQKGLDQGLFYLLIMKDLEDLTYFPVYFQFFNDAQRYRDNIISESKLKVIEIIKLNVLK